MSQNKSQNQTCDMRIKKQQQNLSTNKNVSQRKLRAIKSQKYLSHSQVQMMNGQRLEINNKFVEIRMLTKQKDHLIDQLNTLRQGAVTALQEKQQIIDKLRNQNQRQVYFQDEKQQMQRELSKCQRKIKDLQEERNQIQEKCQKQRTFFFQQIYNKQAIIDELSSRIAHLQVSCDGLQQENTKLNSLVFEYEYKIEKTYQQIQQLRTQINKFNKKVSEPKQVSFNLELNESEILDQKLHSLTEREKDEEKIKQFYQKEMESIILFYERQIKLMRSVFERQLAENNIKKTNETQVFSDQQENDSIYDLLSLKSGFKLKETLNLKNELRKKKQNHADQQMSQFTSKYFSYEPKPLSPSKSSIQETEKEHKQEQNIIEIQQVLQQSRNVVKKQERINKRQIIYCLGGSLVGMIIGAVLIRTIKKV